MTVVHARIDLDDNGGLAEARRRIQAMRARARDLSPAFEVVLDWWALQNAEHWVSRGGRWRTPWKPLHPDTLDDKRRRGFPPDTLVRTGDLIADLTLRPFGVELVTAQSATAGTGLRYAIYHQEGTRRGMPARKLVNADAVAAAGAVSSAVITWVVDGVPKVRSGALG
jgi:hypothetical protein